MSRLVIALPHAIRAGQKPSEWSLDPETLAGFEHYRRRWDGPVVLAAQVAPARTEANPSDTSFTPGDLGLEVSTGETLLQAVQNAVPDVIVAPLDDRIAELEEVLPKTVLVADVAPDELTRRDLGQVPASRRMVARAKGLVRGRRHDQWAQQALGVQCNGYPAHDHYSTVARSSVLFFDSRLTAKQVEAAATRAKHLPNDRPVRAAFSGRWIEAKGVDHAIRLAAGHRHAPHAMQLEVLGTGSDDAVAAAADLPHVTVNGHLDFASEWVPHVQRDIDLMVLPHLQGDPSGTYLESIGCGVPVLGYANVALASLVERHGLGWTAPLGDEKALAERYRWVHRHPGAWLTARQSGLAFMRRHHVDAEYDRRVEHLQSLL